MQNKITLKTAREQGKVEALIAEREASPDPSDGDEDRFNRAASICLAENRLSYNASILQMVRSRVAKERTMDPDTFARELIADFGQLHAVRKLLRLLVAVVLA